MKIFKLIILLLAFIFIFYLFYSLINNKNKIVRYRVVKSPIEEDNDTNDEDIICNDSINCAYKKQKDLYNKCLSCKKKFMCFDENKYKCKFCLFRNKSCSRFGCFGGPPINPNKNNCIKCW